MTYTERFESYTLPWRTVIQTLFKHKEAARRFAVILSLFDNPPSPEYLDDWESYVLDGYNLPK